MGGASVGIRVAVMVGVNKSAPSWVTVGVNVSGVFVAVANRFWVGAAASVGPDVAVTGGGGGGVGVMIRFVKSASDAQLVRKTVNRTM